MRITPACLLIDGSGRKFINYAIEAAKWRQNISTSVRDGSHFAVPKGFDPKPHRSVDRA
jgi:hypothetical protein